MTDQPRGYWNATATAPDFPRLEGDIDADVAIVGGGIVGVTAARLLKDSGRRVALVEARRVGREVTGKSTAKVTSQHGLKYATLEKTFGADKARLYAEAQEEGIAAIRRLAAEHGIDADIEDRNAFLYTLEEDRVSDLEQEEAAARRCGLPAALTRETGLPFDVRAALRFTGQAQFHPTKYVAGLAATIPGRGSQVFEGSPVVDWDSDRIATESGSVRAPVVIMATHMPLGQIGGYYAQAYPHAEPVIAAPVGRPPPEMYKSIDDPSHSIRTHRGADGRTWAICAGNSFKPGHTDEELAAFAGLEEWLAAHFEPSEIAHRWVNEDYKPMDGAPFVGWSKSVGQGWLVATGFAAWGISNGTAAAMILAELAAGREHRWTALFDATRVKPIAGGKEFIKENVSVAAHLVGGYLSSKPKSCSELAPGEAAVLKIDGDNVAAWRDETGRLHAVSAVCTHMGCLLGWNQTDKTWDCPCHGSRFEHDGSVLHGPAVTPLVRKPIED